MHRFVKHAQIEFWDSEGTQLATITPEQLSAFANALLTECQQRVLNCKVIDTATTADHEHFKQWNQALNMATRQLDLLLEEPND